jgi:dipeptidase E
MRKKTIVAIGGGQIRIRGTAAIDREIIRLSGKKHARLLFIPTASSDSERYCRRIEEHFGKFLKCRVDHPLLMKERLSQRQIREKILSAHVIYVGRKHAAMTRLWRRLGVDRLLRGGLRKSSRALRHQRGSDLLVRLGAFRFDVLL